MRPRRLCAAGAVTHLAWALPSKDARLYAHNDLGLGRLPLAGLFSLRFTVAGLKTCAPAAMQDRLKVILRVADVCVRAFAGARLH